MVKSDGEVTLSTSKFSDYNYLSPHKAKRCYEKISICNVSFLASTYKSKIAGEGRNTWCNLFQWHNRDQLKYPEILLKNCNRLEISSFHLENIKCFLFEKTVEIYVGIWAMQLVHFTELWQK